MLLAVELHARQLQRGVEAQWSFQAAGLGEALFEVHVRDFAQAAVDVQALPLLEQLLAIVTAPTGPAFKASLMLCKPALKGWPDVASAAAPNRCLPG